MFYTFEYMVLRHWVRQPLFWVVFAVVLYTIFVGTVVVFRQLNLFTAQYDLGNMDQVLWQSLHGNWFQMMDAGSATLVNRAMFHSDYLLLAYLPFYALVPHPTTLALMQLLATVSAAFPLFWLGKKVLPARVAAGIACSFLAYPPMIWALLFDVHAVVLVIPLMIWMIWAAVERRWWIYALTALGLVLAKEEVGVTVALIGIIVAWWRRPRWIGFATVIFGLAASAFMLTYAIPHARQAPGHFALNYYKDFGSTPSEVVVGMITKPDLVFEKAFNAEGISYLRALLTPVLFLPLLAAPFSFVAGPELAVNLLSSNTNLRTIFFQYTSVLIPIIFLSTIVAAGRLWCRLWRWPKIRFVLAGAYVAATLFSVYWWSLVPYTRHHDQAVAALKYNSYRPGIRHIKRLVQPDDKLVTTNTLGPQFSQRAHIWGFPVKLDQADGIIVLAGSTFELEPKEVIDQEIAKLLIDPKWTLVYRDRDLYYFRPVR